MQEMKQRNLNAALLIAIAFALACNRLQRHTGVAAADWRKELLGQAVDKFSQWSPAQLQKFIATNFNLD